MGDRGRMLPCSVTGPAVDRGQGQHGCRWEAHDVGSQAYYQAAVAAAAAAGESHPLPVPQREDQILLQSPAVVPWHCCCSPLAWHHAGMMTLALGLQNSH